MERISVLLALAFVISTATISHGFIVAESAGNYSGEFVEIPRIANWSIL